MVRVNVHTRRLPTIPLFRNLSLDPPIWSDPSIALIHFRRLPLNIRQQSPGNRTLPLHLSTPQVLPQVHPPPQPSYAFTCESRESGAWARELHHEYPVVYDVISDDGQEVSESAAGMVEEVRLG